jgi:hypothetical protein
MNREGMNLGSATKEQNARETTAAANTVFTSSAAKSHFFSPFPHRHHHHPHL